MVVIYDIETYKNAFTLTVCDLNENFLVLEVSTRKNQANSIRKLLIELRKRNAVMVGFNNVNFDYPILHKLVMENLSAYKAWEFSQTLIGQEDFEKYRTRVPAWREIVRQQDLYLIHHFDNKAKATGLKTIEFNMRSLRIENLPFLPTKELSDDEIETLIEYNTYDVLQTLKFYNASKEKIDFREDLKTKVKFDPTNMNDIKIGRNFFVEKLKEAGIQCYHEDNRAIQTHREFVELKDALLPLSFSSHQFKSAYEWFKNKKWYPNEKEVLFETKFNGIIFSFGVGGCHASLENQVVISDDEHVILDLDVTSYYPHIVIANRFYPEHLGSEFCQVFKKLYDERKKHKKGSVINASIKLALVGVVGSSNSPYGGCVYDPLFYAKVVVNGQLLICKLIESISEELDYQLIQVNTDGFTIKIKKEYQAKLNTICQKWQSDTGLTLEENHYKRMFIQNVNSYLVEKTDGTLKRKKEFNYELEWYQDFSFLIVPKVVERCLLTNEKIMDVLLSWEDKFDFFGRIKVQKTGKLILQDADREKEYPNVSRYVITKEGGYMYKVLPPLAKNPEKWRRFNIPAGKKVKIFNNLEGVDLNSIDIDYDHYKAEIEKILLMF